MRQLHARGKLLLSAEYLVMHGSTALAVPLQYGQTMLPVSASGPGILQWEALEEGRPWFRALIDPAIMDVREATHKDMARMLLRYLESACALQPAFRGTLRGKRVNTNLEFNSAYGFGASSTLTDLLAQWAGADPMALHFMVSGGSGYDVACAQARGPILYTREGDQSHREPAAFSPPFRDHLWFAWLGRKADSAAQVSELRRHFQPAAQDILHFTRLSQAMSQAQSLSEFRLLMEEHESALSSLLGKARIREDFPGLQGSIKSLGAWGGDFVMIATEMTEQALQSYLERKNIRVLFPYKKLIYHE